MRARAFDWANVDGADNEQTPARSTNSSHCFGMMERLALLKALVVIARRFYLKLHA
jgi:hypothetical protein